MTIRIKLHSVIDVITNSSTELFCTVKGEQEAIEQALQDMLDEMGCEAVEFSVSEAENEDGEIIPGQWDIHYDFECKQAPCKMMHKKITKLFKEA